MNGRCSTGRHTDRNAGKQKQFREDLIARDKKCIATGQMDKKLCVASHIIPLNKAELISRADLYSPRNGVFLQEDLEDQYDHHMWFFDCDGKVRVQFSNWAYKDTILRVKISRDPDTGPSKKLIRLHNKMAKEQKKHHCPMCWKLVGAVNIQDHTVSCPPSIKGDD